MINRCITTIAVGKPYYLKLAENLLRSFLLWNQQNDIHFLLLSDNTDFFAAYINLPKIHVHQIDLDQADKSFTSKFKLFEHTIAEENLFIDADCLVYKDLDPVFDVFKGKNFSTIGSNISTGNFFGDVKTMMQKFNIPAMPKFVGCIYYYRNNSIAESIFRKAIQLKSEYTALGFLPLANKENEEPLLAVAMAIENESLVPNDGTVKCDLMYYKKIRSNVLKGYTHTMGPVLAITGGEHIPAEAWPAVLHFNGRFADKYQYQAEVFRLDHAGYNQYILGFLIWVLFTIPNESKLMIKSIFRPLYHYFWGYRDVKRNQRLHE